MKEGTITINVIGADSVAEELERTANQLLEWSAWMANDHFSIYEDHRPLSKRNWRGLLFKRFHRESVHAGAFRTQH